MSPGKLNFFAALVGALTLALVLPFQNCGRFGFGDLGEGASNFFSLGDSRVYSFYWLDSLGPDLATVLVADPQEFAPDVEEVIWTHSLGGQTCDQREGIDGLDESMGLEDLWVVVITCDRPGQLDVTLRLRFSSGEEEVESSRLTLFENPIDRYNRGESLFVNRCASCHFAPATNWPINGKSAGAIQSSIFSIPSMSAQPDLLALTPDDIQRISGYLSSLP